MTGNKKYDYLLGVLSISICVASVGLIFFSRNFVKPEPFSEDVEVMSLINEAKNINNTTPYNLKPMTINLYSGTTRMRYIDMAISILPFNNSQSDKIKKHETLIIDSIINEVSKKTPDDLNSISGRIILESRLKSDINKITGQKVAKELFFTKFIIQ